MMFLSILINIICCTVVGIDLGSDTIKVAVGSKTKPVHLVNNLNSQETTPNIFAFKDRTQWAFGEDASDLCYYNPNICVRTIPLDNQVYDLGEKLKGYEIVALSLLQIIQNVKQVENINDDIKIVVAIPPSTTVREKSFLYNALTVAGLKCIQFVTSTYAPIELYVNENDKYRSSDKVVIIDVGYTGVSVSGFDISRNKIRQTFVEYNDNYGGKTIDENLFKSLVNKYNIHLSILDYRKEKNMLLNLIRQTRESLSSSRYQNSFRFKGKTIYLSTTDVSRQSQEIINCIQRMVSNLRSSQNVNHASVQLIGGCSRIPSIREGIRNIISFERSIDINSAVAMGAVYSATNEIPSSISSHDGLITTETILKSESKVYKLFNDEKTENYSPVIRLSKVGKTQQFHLIDKSDNEREFLRFTLTNLGHSERNQYDSVDLSFALNDFLIPVPYQQTSLVSNREIGVDIEKIGWEVSKNELDASKERIHNIFSGTHKRIHIEKKSNEIEAIKTQVNELLSQYGYLSWKRFALQGINYYIDTQYTQCLDDAQDYSCSEKKIKKLAKTYKDLIRTIIGVDLDEVEESQEEKREKARRIALEEFYDILNACRIADADVDDIQKWADDNIDLASISEINNKIHVLRKRGKRAQEKLFRDL